MDDVPPSTIIGTEELDVDEAPVQEEFIESDYDLPGGDEDYQQVINEQRAMKKKGRAATVPFVDAVDAEEDSETEYDNSSDDHLTELHSEGEGQLRFTEFNEDKELYNPTLRLGMVFRDFDQFKRACRNWGIKNRFQLWFPQNDRKRVICACFNKGCSFRMYAAHMSKDNPSVQIKSANFDHNCGKVFTNYHATSRWLAIKHLDKFKADPHWSCSGIMKQVKDDHGYTITRMKAWRVKNLAMKWVNGDEAEQYTKLLKYAAELMQSNPGSRVILWRDEGVFKGFYVCLKALKDAFWSGCRPFVGFDGCFLKGLYGGQLLSAVGIDPNDCIFPIAYAVVLTENTEAWTWFMELLRDDLEIWNSRYITIMSDRQKGLKRAVQEIFPNAEHRNCVRHIYTNFRHKFKGKALKDLLWNAARATYVQRFNYWLEELEKENPEAKKWLDHEDRPYKSWTRALFTTTSKCDMLLNNICECFNRYILDARDKGIITMLEMIKLQLMRRMKKKKEQMMKYRGIICPKIQKKLDKMKEEGVQYTPDFSGGPKVLIVGVGGEFVVDMVEHTCTCRKWQLTGLPCPHAICAIYGNNQQPEEFVHASYLVTTYMKIYSHYINPTNNEDQWPEVNDGTQVIPPPIRKRQRGRKATARRKEAEEIENASNASKYTTSGKGKQKLSKKGLSIVTCSICHATGHNKRHHAKEQFASSDIGGHDRESIGGNIEREVQGNTPTNVGAKRQKSNTLRSDLHSHPTPAEFPGTQESQSNQLNQVINKGPVINVNISNSGDVSLANLSTMTFQ